MEHYFYFRRVILNILTLSILAVSLTGCESDRGDVLVEVSTDTTTALISEAATENTTGSTAEDTTEAADTTAEATTGETTTETDTTAQTTTEYTFPSAISQNTKAYKTILDQYYTALSESWDLDTLRSSNLNYMCSYHNGTGLQDIGYAFYDIDKNGTNELLIGLVSQENHGGDVFDIYTLTDGKPVMLAQSGERDMYTLCQNSMIKEAASSGASHGYFVFYEYKSGTSKITMTEAVVANSELNPDNPWFYTTSDDVTEQSSYTAITKTEADEIIDKYTAVQISFTPFDHY